LRRPGVHKEESTLSNTRIHIAQGIAVVVAVAALLVPTAAATPLITDTLAPGGTSASSPHFITDTLAPGGVSSVPAADYRFITDTLDPGGGASGVAAVPAGDGFSWADAGIGAVVACGLMLLLVLIERQLGGRRRRRQLAF
jgi:hypothetical protein